jgi:hypothetical protein
VTTAARMSEREVFIEWARKLANAEIAVFAAPCAERSLR